MLYSIDIALILVAVAFVGAMATHWRRPPRDFPLALSWHRSFTPAGEGERFANYGHENGHEHSNTSVATPTCAGTETPVIADELTPCEMCRD